MGTKWTPGPWVAYLGNKYMHVKSVDGSYVMEAQSTHGGIVRQHADANLIAAAPELYEALKDIITQYPLIHGEPVPAWIRNGAAALKKARGEQ